MSSMIIFKAQHHYPTAQFQNLQVLLGDDLTIMPTVNGGSLNYREIQWIILFYTDNLLHTQLI